MSQYNCISVDLDSLPHYARIHGLADLKLDDQALGLVGTKAIPRFLELFDKGKIPATFFAIGAELQMDHTRSAVACAHHTGVEIASHSYSHDYRMSLWSDDALQADLEKCEQMIAQCTGVRPVGFRAPGYTLSSGLLQALKTRGYLYDSSVFPAAPYYLAKAAVMAGLWVKRTPSASMLDTPKVLLAPTDPYWIESKRPYRTKGKKDERALVEMPIAVAPLTRFPFIGTFAMTLPWRMVERLYRVCSQRNLLNFELHAIDVLDGTDGIPGALVAAQKDLQIPAAEKMRRLRDLFSRMKTDGECVVLSTAARNFQGVKVAAVA